MTPFGKRFRAILCKRGLTQVMAAKQLGCRQSAISYYSNLERTPRRGTLLNMAERLGVSIAELTGQKEGGERGKADVSRTVSSQEVHSRALANEVMQELKRRWQKRPHERDTIKHLVAALFSEHSERILGWLDQK